MAKTKPTKKRRGTFAAANSLGLLGKGVGYSIDEAYTVRAAYGTSVVDLEGGGYAVPIVRSKKIAPPSKTVPISAAVPSGVVKILPGAYGWRIVR